MSKRLYQLWEDAQNAIADMNEAWRDYDRCGYDPEGCRKRWYEEAKDKADEAVLALLKKGRELE